MLSSVAAVLALLCPVFEDRQKREVWEGLYGKCHSAPCLSLYLCHGFLCGEGLEVVERLRLGTRSVQAGRQGSGLQWIMFAALCLLRLGV